MMMTMILMIISSWYSTQSMHGVRWHILWRYRGVHSSSETACTYYFQVLWKWISAEMNWFSDFLKLLRYAVSVIAFCVCSTWFAFPLAFRPTPGFGLTLLGSRGPPFPVSSYTIDDHQVSADPGRSLTVLAETDVSTWSVKILPVTLVQRYMNLLDRREILQNSVVIELLSICRQHWPCWASWSICCITAIRTKATHHDAVVVHTNKQTYITYIHTRHVCM